MYPLYLTREFIEGEILYWCEADLHEKMHAALSRYFRLDVDLSALYAEWSERDRHFAKSSSKCPGVRLLDQPAFESLLSFICSQNNGISRITSMVRTLKESFGENLYIMDDAVKLYSFPTPETLANPKVTNTLKAKGFGYRSRYIQIAAQNILNGLLHLESLKNCPYEAAWKVLIGITGVGPKVADCVALTGLGQQAAVPIDTHIWKVAKSYYSGMPSGVSLTTKVYISIANRFRSIFGPRAGWAHLVLFAVQIKEKPNTRNKP